MNQAPGWYPNPNDPTTHRYWDGAKWTDDVGQPTMPLPSVGAPPPPPHGYHVGSASAQPWYKSKAAKISGGVVAGLVIIGLLVPSEDAPVPASSSPEPAPTVTVTAEPEATPEPEPESEQELPAPEVKAEESKPTKPKKPATSSGSDDSFVVLDATGMSLQGAQDALQEISGNPFYFSYSEDATGDGRGQWVDSGWQVCSQVPAPGTTVQTYDGEDVTFYVVRDSETCP